MKTNRCLVIIDPQLDFIIGSLAVSGAEKAINNLIGHLISTDQDHYDNIIITKDWHIENHPSFKENGGVWPPHCVQNSFGSNMPFELIEALSMSTYAPSMIVKKGEEKEAYGGFESINSDLANIFRKANKIHIAGIAGDFCVKESTKQLIEKGYGKKIVMLDNCIASINQEDYESFKKEFNLDSINATLADKTETNA